MELPYEILVMIAMCNYKAYKALTFTDWRLYRLLHSVDKIAHFSGRINNNAAHGIASNYYLCWQEFTYPESIRVIKGNITKDIRIHRSRDLVSIVRIVRNVQLLFTMYRETVVFGTNCIITVKRTKELMNSKVMMEKWSPIARVYTMSTYGASPNHTYKIKTHTTEPMYVIKPSWEIRHASFVYKFE